MQTELLQQLRDELRGLLLESFAATRDPRAFAGHGHEMAEQMRRGHNLFDRIVAAAAPALPAKVPAQQPVNKPPVTNGKPAETKPRMT